MSAMHWEARRRQQVLDRRSSARAKLEVKQNEKEEQPDVIPCEPAEPDKRCICQCHAKMNKRYTSLQYSQQW